MAYKEYESKCETIEAENEALLDLFEEVLKSFSTKTIRQHRNNLCFFLNDYLLYEKPLTFDAGPDRVDDYLGYFFIRKFAWATPASIRRNAASIKKFYKSMVNHGKIAEADYEILCKTIKNKCRSGWQIANNTMILIGRAPFDRGVELAK